MMIVNLISYKRVEGKDRIEDLYPDHIAKKKFEKYINCYLKKIRRCNIYWSILKEEKLDSNKYINSYNIAPSFWSAVKYSIQMGLVTDLCSFLSEDEASLKTYFHQMMLNKDYIFSKRFFSTWINAQTKEEHEEEWKNHKTNDSYLKDCEQMLNECIALLPKLKKARDKIYVHLDKKTLDLDKCNKEILQKIENESIELLLKNIAEIISVLYSLYTNIKPATEYVNQNDVRNVFWILDMYENNTKEILALLHNKNKF